MVQILEKYINTQLIKNISCDLIEWLAAFRNVAPNNVFDRKASSFGVFFLIKNITGLFIKPLGRDEKILYVFQGLRNKNYMKIFDPNSVMIIGSHLEKKYAYDQGYLFCWTFPIINAVNGKLYRDWNFFISIQLKIWWTFISKFKHVIFFLYEDTQPVGCFLAHLIKLNKQCATSVCIQHGYFDKYNYGLRHEGAICDINFLWDINQARVIGCDLERAYEIGLPYFAKARSTSELIFILVGIGEYGYGTENYDISLDVFWSLSVNLKQAVKCKVYYRPHPNEWKFEDQILKLRERFSLIDELSKEDRMNDSRAIFIGTISSLLFEAKKAGHYVVQIELFEKQMLAFEPDFTFQPQDATCLINWILDINKNIAANERTSLETTDAPQKQFIQALHFAKLVPNLSNMSKK